MRILYFGIYENNGGLENFAKNLITSIKSINPAIDFTILATTENFTFRDQLEKQGCSVVVLPNPHKSLLKFYKALKAELKKYDKKDTVIHLNICSYRNYFLFKACKQSGIKTIIVGHYTKIDDGKMPWLHTINRNIYKNFGTCVSNSDDVSLFMFHKKTKITFINNGVPCDRFSYNNDFRKEIRANIAPNNEFIVGQIGRISPEKNQLFSVMVLQKLLQFLPNARLILVGKEMYDEPREYAIHNHLTEYILFTGPIYSQVEKYYSAFDVCLLPSLNEGMSLSLLECISNGVPSIFSNNVPTLNKARPNNIYYIPLDIDSWVNLIVEIANTDPKERINPLVGTDYDLEKCATNYLLLYKRVIQE